MKVKELIEYLKREDQEEEVYIECYSQNKGYEIDEVTNGVDKNQNPITAIFINPINEQ
ncbi:hypothetical protein [Clostridium butyricum]|uniref:hypothetical protein n=1 Tax=Clostridium butyricum TaxID=1492 RepID=UPI0016526A91|nr:hypothetical protein [Clostridium butyricum]